MFTPKFIRPAWYPEYHVDIFGQRIYPGPQHERDLDRDDRSYDYPEHDRDYSNQYDYPEAQAPPEYPFHDFNYGP